ncbi:LysR family transcriptional regulator [Agromyces sp. Marseille-P2726]|uniref:LysR family transcriptional regulator n=1 Tax=Agromyces sp. Marseille-P2726 TaxID=2709132 RepID=UPI00156E725D|nr:LysR family transcriptional regulator [Agromyces sp. Marseille-P2726]
MLDLEKLRNFVTVAKTGSFVRAAEELNLSQPGLSRSIQALERQFGVRLLDRDRRAVRVTAAGRQLLDQAIDLLSSARAIEKGLSAAADGLSGTVRFGVGPFAVTALLPQVLARFAESGPHLDVEVAIASKLSLTQQLLDDEIEFFVGVLDDFVDDPTYACVALAEIGTKIYVRPGHPLAGRACRIADLETFPIASGHDLGAGLRLARQGAPSHRTTFMVDDLHVLAEVCLSSDSVLIAGYGTIPRELVEVTIDERESVPKYMLGIISIRSRTVSPAAELVRTELLRTGRRVA